MPDKAATTRPMAKCRADGLVKTSADDAIPDLLFLFHVYPTSPLPSSSSASKQIFSFVNVMQTGGEL
jgi:hypothetical protein